MTDTRKIADLTDEEIISEMEEMGLSFEPDNSGDGPQILRETLHSLATNFEPLLTA
jgi:hypothetical protein